MINFRKLKLKGFKSFVEPTDIIIEKGLTGIVGPNGCGKSNLVEAFRFVMGELSPNKCVEVSLMMLFSMAQLIVLPGISPKLQ